MKMMKRLLALLLALTMVMPNFLTIASAYSDEEIVEEIVEELEEEVIAEEVCEEIVEEVESETSEEISEEIAEEVAEEPEFGGHSVSNEAAASAAEETTETSEETFDSCLYVPEDSALADPEELFAGHFWSVLDPDMPSVMGTAGRDGLDEGSNAALAYDAVAPILRKIASGERQSTMIVMGLQESADKYGYTLDAAVDFNGFTGTDMDELLHALLVDMPYDLYWFDKMTGIASYGLLTSGDLVILYFAVSEDYRTEGATADYTYEGQDADGNTLVIEYYCQTDLLLTSVASATVERAQEVVEERAGLETDYDKLAAYRDWICDNVAYNYDAVNTETAYGDPWQVIWVFDGDETTDVVCEGYSKALQYLCDLTFTESTACYSVTGTLYQTTDGVTDPVGAHMWNIVELDGQPYLVDLTNVDIMEDETTLFLAGGAPSDDEGNYYTFGTLGYAYSEDTIENFDRGILTLADAYYEPPMEDGSPSGSESAGEEAEGDSGESSGENTDGIMTQEALLAALNNASSGDTITLSGSVTITDGFTIPEGVTLEVAQDTTLTLDNVRNHLTINGHLLVESGAKLSIGEAYTVQVRGGTVTISDGAELEMVRRNITVLPDTACTVSGIDNERLVAQYEPVDQDNLNTALKACDTYGAVNIVPRCDIALGFLPGNVNLMGTASEQDEEGNAHGWTMSIPASSTGAELSLEGTLMVGPYWSLEIAEGAKVNLTGTLMNNGTVINNGTLTNNGTITGSGTWEGADPVSGGTDVTITTGDALCEALASAESGDTITLSGSVTITDGFTIPEGVTLEVAEDVTLTNAANSQIMVTGTLNIAGELVNNGGIFMASDAASLVVTGSVTNAGQISTEGTAATMDFSDGGYSGSGKLMASYGHEGNVTGVSSSELYLCAYAADDVEGINAVQAAVTGGGYAGATISISSDMEIFAGEGLTIAESTILMVRYDCTLTNNGEIINNGTFGLSMRGGDSNTGAVLDNNGLFTNNGTFIGTSLSTVDNNGILENKDSGTMEIYGTYNHNGELKIYTRHGETGLEINDIVGVDNGLKTIVTYTNDLGEMDQGFAFGNDFGQTQVHMIDDRDFLDGLTLEGNYDLHIYGNAIIDGDVVMNGGQLHVEEGASLTTNDAIWMMQGANVYIHRTYDPGNSADGVLNAKGPIHIGFDTESDGSWATGNLTVDGVLNTNEYVNIRENAQLNINGTMTQKNVIIENHGSINVYGTLNQNYEICNYGMMTVDGTLKQSGEIKNNGSMTVNGTLNVNSGNVWNEDGGTMTINKDAKLSFAEGSSICVWENGSLYNSADLTDKGTCINVRIWDYANITGVPKANIYATYFVNSEEDLNNAIDDATNDEGVLVYGFAEFMPMSSFRIFDHVTIPAGTILQLWKQGKTISVTVSNQASLTTEEGGGIIINPDTRLNVEQGGVLYNYGWVQVTNEGNEKDEMTPGILWYYDDDDDDPDNWDALEGNDIDTKPGGFTVKGTMTQTELKDKLADDTTNEWVHESYTQLDEGGTLTINKPFYLDYYGTIVVPNGSTLVIDAYFKLIGGNIYVHQGGKLVLKNQLDIFDGTVFVDNNGENPGTVEYNGGWTNGDITYAASYDEEGNESSGTLPYFSANWVHHNGEGWYVNNNDYPELRDLSMPNADWKFIFFLNVFDDLNKTWARIPVPVEHLIAGDHVVLTPVSEYEWEEPAPGYEELFPYFVEISYDSDTLWDVNTCIEYEYGTDDGYDLMSFNIRVERNQEHGFYSSETASNDTWLNSYTISPLIGVPELYYIFTDSNSTVTEAALTEGGDIVEFFERIDTNAWKITLKEDVVANIWTNGDIDNNIKVVATVTDGENTRTTATSIWGQIWWPNEYQDDAYMELAINGELCGYRYYQDFDKWIRFTENGSEIADVEALGISYDASTNTMTLNGDNQDTVIGAIHMGYSGTDDQGNRYTNFPDANLTIKLIGEYTIEDTVGTMLQIWGGLNVTIVDAAETGTEDETETSTGVLNLVCSSAENHIAAIDVTPESSLTLSSGTINVTNADLWLGGVVEINGATVNVAHAQVHVDNRLDLNSGALNVTSMGSVNPHDETGEPHTHYESIVVSAGNTLNVNGGALTVTVPGGATTPTAFYHGISLEAGTLNINGGTVTVDGPDNIDGYGIKLGPCYDENGPIEGSKSYFNMNGGKLVMQEALFDDYGMTRAIWGDGSAEVTVNGGEMELDAVYVELNGTTTWNGGTVNGEEVLFMAGGEIIINDGEFNLTGNTPDGLSALFRAYGMVSMNGGKINITNGFLGVPTAFSLNGGEVTITNDERYTDCWGVWVGKYLAINGGTLTVNVPGGQWINPETDEITVYPAVWVDGTLHQMGGTVNITSGSTAAIRSHGSVLLNGGTMNLSGKYGIGQFGEGYREDMGMFYVSGGKLNIDATDTGIFANNSSVRFVPGEDESGNIISDPTVTINAKEAAIQIVSNGSDSGLVNAYAFVNADGDELVLNSVDRRAEPDYGCYVHTLMDGDEYATYVAMKTVVTIESDNDWSNMIGSGDVYNTSRDMVITGQVTLPKTVIFQSTATLTVEAGAILTIPAGVDLVAEMDSHILVKDGGKIDNYGLLVSNSGDITIENAETGYVGNEGSDIYLHYNYGEAGTITGISVDKISVPAVVGTTEQVEQINALMESGGYASAAIYVYDDLTIAGPELEGLPYEVHVTPKVKWFVYGGAVITVDANAFLIIDQGARMDLNGNKIIVDGQLFNYGTLNVDGGNITVTAGDYHCLTNCGNLNVGGATLSIQGNLYNNTPLFLVNGAILTVDGRLENYAPIHVAYPTEQSSSGQLNVNGTMYNYDYLNVCEGATVNVSGVLNNCSVELNEVKNGSIENHGTINVTGSGALNVEANAMTQAGTLNVSGMMNISNATFYNVGTTILETTEFGGASVAVNAGGSLRVIDGGVLHVQSGARLTNYEADIRIRMGTLYVYEGGIIEDRWDGTITREGNTSEGDWESTNSYISSNWLDNDGNGWYENVDGGESRDMRILPGEDRWVIFYENIWKEDGLYWERKPISITSNDSNLTLKTLSSLDETFADSENEYNAYFVKMTAGDTWDTTVNLGYGSYPTYDVTIGRDQTHGFYSSATASNDTWLDCIEVDNLAEPIEDKVVYFILTDENWVMTGEQWLDLPEGIEVTPEYQNDGKAIKVTIPENTIASMTEGFRLNVNYKIRPSSGSGDEEQWSYGIDVNCINLDDISTDAWFRIDDQDLEYSAKRDMWLTWGEHGREITKLPTGVSYDLTSNTLTMNNAKLSSLEVGYYGWDENGRNDLPSQKLTLNLIGQNFITSTTDHALKVYHGVQLDITSKTGGSLYLCTTNSDQMFNEEEQYWYSCSTVNIGNEESSLTISGDAEVTVEVTGQGWYTDNGEKKASHLNAIEADWGLKGTEKGNVLTVTGSATLTTKVPEGATRGNEMPDYTGFQGGYGGINNFGTINISDNATVVTQDIDLGNGIYNQTGGTVTINALGYTAPHDQNQAVAHTHFNGLSVEAGDQGFVAITGGALNINIPAGTTESVWYNGIRMDGGKLNIGGDAVVTIDGKTEGNGIELNHAAMSLDGNAVLNFNEEPFIWITEEGRTSLSRTNAIRSDDQSHVSMNGGTVNATAVNFEFNGSTYVDEETDVSSNGKTEWNGTVLNGSMVYFVAGGNDFTMNDGEINLSGQQYNESRFINSVFDVYGMVTMNGGKINITDGVLVVPNAFSLDGGEVTIKNTYDQMEGLYVSSYMAINGGTLTVTVPGGSYQNQADETVSIPAVWVDGTLHQMGGTVNITSGSTEAIKSYGSVLLNGGTMNLTGASGVGMFHNDDWKGEAEQMFFASGGVLNIEATEFGIFTINTPVVFAYGEDQDNVTTPVVNIAAKTAYYSMSDSAENSYLDSCFSLVNADGKTVTMGYDKHVEIGEETYTYYIHTLRESDGTAAAEVTLVIRMSQAAFEKAVAEGNYSLTEEVVIETDMTLVNSVWVEAGGTLTVASGATLTIPEGVELMAQNGGWIVVEAGGEIRNSGSLVNMYGTITIAENGYVNNGGTVYKSSFGTSEGPKLGETTGIDEKAQVLQYSCYSLDQLRTAIGIAEDYSMADIDLWVSGDQTLTSDLTIPENTHVIFNSPYDSDGTVVAGLIVPNGITLTIATASAEGNNPGSLFMNNGSVLTVCSGGTVNNYGSLHMGDWQNGNFVNGGTLNIEEDAVVNTWGYLALHEEFNGLMTVAGALNNKNDEDGCGNLDNRGRVTVTGTLNQDGQMYIGGALTVDGTVINNGEIDPVAADASISFASTASYSGTGALYQHYLEDGTLSNVTGVAKENITLCYSGSDAAAAKAMIDVAEGYGHYLITVSGIMNLTQSMQIKANGRLNVTPGSKLIVRSGATLDNSGEIDLCSVTDEETGVTTAGALVMNAGSMLYNFGTFRAEEKSKLTINAKGNVYNYGSFETLAGSQLSNSGVLSTGNLIGNNNTVSMEINGSYSHNGTLYVNMNTDGETGNLSGNVSKSQKTLFVSIDAEDEKNTQLTSAIAAAGDYGRVEIYLGEAATVEALQIPENVTLYLSGALTVDTLTNSGTIVFDGGTLKGKFGTSTGTFKGTSSDISWTVKNGTLTIISGTGAIPDYSEGAPAPWNDLNSIITKVNLDAGITAIGANAFSGCTAVATITIPAQVTTIGSNAFHDNTKLMIYHEHSLGENVGGLDKDAYEYIHVLTAAGDCEYMETCGYSLSAIVKSDDSAAQKIEDVQKLDTDVLQKQMEDELHGEQTGSTTTDLLKQLENQIKEDNNVTVEATINEELSEEFAGTATIDNAAISAAESGTDDEASKVELVVDVPQVAVNVDGEIYSTESTVMFSMTLEGVKDSSDLVIPVTITLPLPASLNAYTDSITVLHYHDDLENPEVVPCSVIELDGVKYITFIVKKFSEFAVTADAVAKIEDRTFATLSDAVEAAEEEDTIILMKDGQTATIAKAVTIDLNSKSAQITLDENYENVDTTGNYRIQKKQDVAQVGDTLYWSMEQALKDAADTENAVVLLADVTDTLTVGGNVTIDRNGHVAEIEAADGYRLTNVNDQVVRIEKIPYVAQIGDDRFETIAEAVQTAMSEDTIVLLADIAETVSINKAVTIRKGEFRMNVTPGSDYYAKTTEDGLLMILPYAAKIGTNGYLTFADALTEADEGAIIDLLMDVKAETAISQTVTIRLNGHNITGYDSETDNYGAKTTEDGLLMILPYVAQIDDTKYFTLTDAYNKANDSDTITLLTMPAEGDVVAFGKAVTVVVGEINYAPQCAEGWKAVKAEADGTYTIQKIVYVAQVGEKNYETLAEALTAAGEGGTVTLLENITITDPIGQAVIIRHNDKTITGITADTGYVLADSDDSYYIAMEFGVWNSNMTLGNSLRMNFWIEKVDLLPNVEYYTTITKTYADGRPDVVKTIEFADWEDYNSNYFRVSFDGIAAKEMSDEIYVQVFFSDGTPASRVFTDSIQLYAEYMLQYYTSGETATAMVDMLNYGTAAQELFKYNTSDPANAVLSDAQQTLATQSFTATDNWEGGNLYYNTTLSLEDNIVLNLLFKDITEDMYAVVSYTDHYGHEKSEKIPYTEMQHRSGGIHAIAMDSLVIADGRQIVTCEIYNGDGEKVGGCKDSVEGYLAAMMKYSDDALYPNTLKFIISAYNLLH